MEPTDFREIARLERAFGELVDEAEGEERDWCEQARVVFLTVVSAGLRRGEILRGYGGVTSASPTAQTRSGASRRPGSAEESTRRSRRRRNGRSRSASGYASEPPRRQESRRRR